MTEPIIIAGTQIRCDHEGRFCINDLHRASGGHKRHQPSNWVSLQQTQALIGAIERKMAQEGGDCFIAPLVSRQGLGSFGVKSLVYAYAMWISPEFNLRVIEAYDALQMDKLRQREPNSIVLPDFNDPVAAARAWADKAEKVRALASLAKEQGEHLKAAIPALEFHAAVANSKDSVTIGQFAKLMGTGELRLFELLRREQILITGSARHNLPYQKHIDAERFRVIENAFEDEKGRVHLRFQTRITPKGQLWLQRRYFPNDSHALAQVPQLLQIESTALEPPALPVYSEPRTTTMDSLESDISGLREQRRKMQERPGKVSPEPIPAARAPLTGPVLAAVRSVQASLPLGDEFTEPQPTPRSKEELLQRLRN
jgi:phage antirepressor YoqD-like protein